MNDASIPPCQFGYLSLTNDVDEKVLIKANKITAIQQYEENVENIFLSTIYACSDDVFTVVESFEQILAQLESIHPTLR